MKKMLVGAAALSLAVGCSVVAGCGSSSNGPAPAPDAGSAPMANLSATQLDFGPNDCGGTAAADQSITITNGGEQALSFTASLDAIDLFTINGPASGSIPAAGTAKIAVSAKAVPASATAGQVFSAKLTITTNDPGNATLVVPVGLTAQGGTLVLGKPSLADFGQVPVGTAAPAIPLTLTNTGNKAVTVAFTQPTNKDFTIAPAAGGSIDPGKSLSGLAANFKPSSAPMSAVHTSAAIAVTGAVCGVSPESIGLAGQGTAGALAYSPGTIDFGMTPCQTTGSMQPLGIGNVGTEPFTWTVALTGAAQSPFTLQQTSGTVLPGQSVNVGITPKPLPYPADVTANKYGDTLTLTTNLAGDKPHTINLLQTAQGVILAVTVPQTALDIGAVQLTKSNTGTFAVTNSGNLDTTLTFGVWGGQQSPFSVAQLKATAGGAPTNETVTFGPTQYIGIATDTVFIQNWTGPLCADITPSNNNVPVKGTGYDLGTKVWASGLDTVGYGKAGYGWEWGNWFGSNWALPKELQGALGAASDDNGNTCYVKGDGTVKCYGGWFSGTWGQDRGLSGITSITENRAGSGYVWGENYGYHCAGGCRYWDSSNNGGGGGGEMWCATKNDGTVWCATDNNNNWTQISTISGSGGVSIQSSDTYQTQTWNDTLYIPPNYGYCWDSYYHYCSNSGGGWYCLPANGSASWASFTVSCNFGSPAQVCSMASSGGAVSCGDMSGFSGTLSNYGAIGVNAYAISAGDRHTCAANTNGKVSCWGNGGSGQLGNGSWGNSQSPVSWSLSGGNSASVASGRFHSCATDASGNVYCWGGNNEGELGNGNQGTNSNSPVGVSGLSGATSLSAGYWHNCAVASNQIYCWGYNGQEQVNAGVNGGINNVPWAVRYLQAH